MDLKDLDLTTFRLNESLYLEQLKNPKNWNNIPLLNYIPSDNLKDLHLVRFRGMIQDMFNPEIYFERYEVIEKQQENDDDKMTTGHDHDDNLPQHSRIQDGKYRDCLLLKSNEVVNYDSTSNVFGERRTILAISIPGLNKWAIDIENNNQITNRKLQNDSCSSSSSSSTSTSSLSNKSGQKRLIDENFGGGVEEDVMNINEQLSSVILTNNKKICTDELKLKNNNKNLLSSEYLLNSPINERPSKACMIKLYKDFDKFKLNSIIDCIGFLSIDPSLDGSNMLSTTDDINDDNFMNINEIHATNPPPSLIPRLHAIVINEMKYVNPVLDMMDSIENFTDQSINFEVLRNDLKLILTQCLFGDDLAADYLLSHLISNIYVRTDFQTLGQATLNISNIPSTDILPEYTIKLYEILESLLPVSHYFPMTLDNMNTTQFVPKKDYITNRLTSGLLQLAPHTHLILDETKLQAGKLETNGVLGVKSLSHLIKTQQIKYNFEFYEIDFNTNIPILILSQGKSMLPSDFHIPLNINDKKENYELIMETLKAAKHYLQKKYNDIRKYITISKLKKFEISSNNNNMKEIIENDFVEMRRNDKNYGLDEFNSLLLISRFYGISKGKNYLDKDIWENAKRMEKIRKSRFNQNNEKLLSNDE